jgi:DNA repair photolyase
MRRYHLANKAPPGREEAGRETRFQINVYVPPSPTGAAALIRAVLACPNMSYLWYNGIPKLESKSSKSLIHSFIVKDYQGLTINPYQGCQHRCAYCYATYEWSPDFYDKIYAKSNAAEVLDKQLAKWGPETIGSVMVSSATDCYQPAEVRFGLTRKCIEVLQRYNVPYYVFTKSVLVERDLELHKSYKHNCTIIWSVTTVDEEVRRVIEPGTPPAERIFSVIRKFVEAGVCCGVNVDPIIPIVADGSEAMDALANCCKVAGVRHVFGALLRLRADIWERMKMVFKLLGIPDAEEQYRSLYGFREPMGSSYVSVREDYAKNILQQLEEKVVGLGMSCKFPHHLGHKTIDKSHLGQTNLMSYVA